MLQRNLVERIENRILVGIVMFIGILLLVGWQSIKENARMASFEQQFDARSVERGAKLFSASCSTCHNADGRGITGRAPGLNSPHFFGFDYYAEPKARLAELNQPLVVPQNEIADLSAEITVLEGELAAIEGEQTTLATELQTADDTRKAEIETRQSEIATRLGEIPSEIEALTAQIEPLQAQVDTYVTENQAAYDEIAAEFALLDEQLLPATLNGYPDRTTLDANPTWYWRLNQANWLSTQDTYITTTLIHGRPQNAGLWGGNIMAPWSTRGGGPMRDDQIADIVAYVMNWDKGSEWTLEDALAVNQFAQVPGAGGGGDVTGDPVGTDVDAIVAQLTGGEVVGDPTRGETIYNNRGFSQLGERLGCSGCHVGGVQGPSTDEQWENIPAQRLTLPQFAGYTMEKYLVESIVNPSAYIVPGYEGVMMPQNFGERMSIQDMADIIQYIHSFSPNYIAPELPADTGDTDTSTSETDEETAPEVPTVEGTAAPTTEATAVATTEATVEATTESTTEATTEPTTEATAEPTAEPTVEPTPTS